MFCVILCVLALVGTTTMTSCTKDDWNWFADLVGELDDMVNDSTSNDEGVNEGEDEDDNDGDNDGDDDVDYSQLIRGTWVTDNTSYERDEVTSYVANWRGETIVFYAGNQVQIASWSRRPYILDGDYFEMDGYTGRIIELTSQKLVLELRCRNMFYHLSCDRVW